jgi:hypothetical protein
MKITYVLTEDIEAHPGLKNKILGQVRIWVQKGHHVNLVSHRNGMVLDAKGCILFSDRGLAKRDDRVLNRENTLFRLTLFKEQYRFLYKAIDRLSPDLTYTRYAFPFIGLKKAFNRGKPYVVEINSDDRIEYYLKHRTTGIYNHLFRRAFYGNSSGFVFVTHDLSRAPSFRRFKAQHCVIANGIDTQRFPFVAHVDNSRPQLCFVGSPDQRWHGLQQVGQIARALPHATVHVIGPSRQEYENADDRVPDNMVFHGYLQDAQVKTIVSAMDVGISTLALYEKRMNEACPLKARQYFAQGIPAIGCYQDTDIEQESFYLQLPNARDNVAGAIEKIRSFVSRVHGDLDLRKTVRSFAEQTLDTRIKENNRLQFFEKVLDA